jgi:hypothetical protein
MRADKYLLSPLCSVLFSVRAEKFSIQISPEAVKHREVTEMQDETAEIHEERKYLSVEELAVRHKCTASAIYQRRWRGDGPPAFKIGKKLLFPRGELEDWERSQAVSAGPTRSLQ